MLALLITMAGKPLPIIAQYNSQNYKVEENSIDSGGELDGQSPNYRAKSGIGELGVGRNSSTNYIANSGFNTTDEDYLEFTISGSTVSLGNLTTTSTGTGTATFSVRVYMSSGYVVKTMSQPPASENGAVLTGMPSATTSSQGTEQFGINLVANTSPASFGSNRSHIPDDTFAFGEPSTGYNTANNYKYVVGDTIAASAIGEGQTNFTISYIANVSVLTSAGSYRMSHDLVVVPTF